jgi:hypothetical protein
MFSKGKHNETVWVPKERFDSYRAGPQPHVESTPQEAGDDKDHGEVHKVVLTHDFQHGKHSITASHVDGHTSDHDYDTGAEARKAAEEFEEGGETSRTDVKRREHKDQQSASSEEDNWEAPELV